MSQPLLKYFTPALEQPLIKTIGPSADGDSTVFYVLATPLGSAKKLDLHGDYFMEDTHYGDPRIKTLPAFYEHLMNDHNNPYMAEMGVEKMELGISTLLTEEQKKDHGLSLAERWASFEVKRSLEYHDMLCNLVEKNLMGMSTQTFPNGKTRNPDGGLKRWIENERSMTPTPAATATLGRVIEVYKTFKAATPALPVLKMVKNGQIVDVNFDDPDAVNAVLAGTTISEPEVPVTDIAAEVEALLGEPAVDEVVDTKSFQEIKADVDAMKAILEDMKASMSVFFDLWGTPEELREAIMTMLGQPKALSAFEAKMISIEKSILVMANALKTMKGEDIKQKQSPREKEIIDEPKQPGQLQVLKSGVPETLRREAK